MKKFSEIDKNYIDNLEVKNSCNAISRNMTGRFSTKEGVSRKSKHLDKLLKEVLKRSKEYAVTSYFEYDNIHNKFEVRYTLYSKTILLKMKELEYLIEIDNLNLEEFGKFLIALKENGGYGVSVIGISGKLYSDEGLYFSYKFVEEVSNNSIIKNTKRYEWFGRVYALDIVGECINTLKSKITQDFCPISECKIKNLYLEVFNTTFPFEIKYSKIKNCFIEYGMIKQETDDEHIFVTDCSLETLEIKIHKHYKNLQIHLSEDIETLNMDLSEFKKASGKMPEIKNCGRIGKINIIISRNGNKFEDLKTLDGIIKALFKNKIQVVKKINSKEAIIKMEVITDETITYEIPVSLISE